jgi:hypothetical protein
MIVMLRASLSMKVLAILKQTELVTSESDSSLNIAAFNPRFR